MIHDGAVCVNAKKFYDLVKLAPRGEIHFSTDAKSYDLHIQCEKSKFRLAGKSRDEYPELPAVRVGKRTVLPCEVMSAFIRHTSFAVTNEQSRFTLSGAKFEIGGSRAKMITTDGHRLAYIETELETDSPVVTDAIIPRKALAELLKICQSGSDQLMFSEDANHLYFESADRTLVTRKLAGNFPNYEMVIPRDNREFVVFDGSELLAAINRVSQMSDERSRSIVLSLKSNEMKISAKSAEEGEADETIGVEYAGEEIAIKFQHEYIRDFIAAVKDDKEPKFQMTFKNNSAQCLFRPANENGRIFQTVIMPLQY